jgi:methionine-rich copper-binding protein CopC
VAALLAGTPPATAHDRLVASDPSAGEVLPAAPAAVTLTFDQAVLPISPVLVVLDATGAAVVDDPPSVEGRVVTVAAPPGLPPGVYHVAWRVVSGDGHPVEGTFTFEVAAPTAPASPQPQEPATAAPAGTGQPASPTAGPTPGGPTGVGSLVTYALALALAGAVAAAAVGVAQRRRR